MSDSNERRFLVAHLRRLSDMNELTSHLLEVFRLRLIHRQQENTEQSIKLKYSSLGLEGNEQQLISPASISSSVGTSLSRSNSSSTSDTDTDDDSDQGDGAKRPSKRVKFMKRKREKKLAAFTKLKQIRDHKCKEPDSSIVLLDEVSDQ